MKLRTIVKTEYFLRVFPEEKIYVKALMPFTRCLQ